MPNWGYSIKEFDAEKGVKASGRDLRISPKAAREICSAIRKMRLTKAQEYLERVVELKEVVPYKRHKKKVAHRRGLQGWYAGRYPVKAAKAILKVLRGLQANAENKGLDVERLKLVHAAAQRGTKIRRFRPRAFGRASPFNQQLTHVEFVAIEV